MTDPSALPKLAKLRAEIIETLFLRTEQRDQGVAQNLAVMSELAAFLAEVGQLLSEEMKLLAQTLSEDPVHSNQELPPSAGGADD